MKGSKRIAFGQNGKGRYGPFCFADEYDLETWKNGESIQANIKLTQGGTEPFHFDLKQGVSKAGHGTCVSAAVIKNLISVDAVSEAIGSKFIVDPFFTVTVNGRKLELISLSSVSSSTIEVDSYGALILYQIDALAQDRTTHLRGVTWWVNGRMVGTPSWDGLDARGAILDGRTVLAKRCSFVVVADLLREDVKADWSGFHDTAKSIAVRDAVRSTVMEALARLLSDTRKERKREALAENRSVLDRLPTLSKRVIGTFIDDVQQNCPTLSQGDLIRTVKVLASLEKARSGYELLEKLAGCSPDDLDTWNRLMEEWTARNAEVVLSELKRRIDLIERLQQLINVTSTDELHELQPLFARGLWVFGPEYESIEFTANRAMATVVRQLLGGAEGDYSSRRPDVVALPDRSIGIYSADSFDADSEVGGIRKVLIVELKKGGAVIGTAELRQGEDYALELQKTNMVAKNTEIVVYVLGTRIAADAAEERTVGMTIKVIPKMYDMILKRAHARTFNLQRKLQAVEPSTPVDEDMEEVLATPLFGREVGNN